MLLLRMLAWGAEGSSGRLQDWVGQDAESPPLIRQTLPARRRRPSPKSPGDVLPLSFGTRRASPRPAFQPGFHPCGCGRRPASASIGRWVVCVFTQPKDSMGRMDHGSYHDDGRVRVPLTWAPFPSVAKHVSWTASKSNKDAVISPLQAQHDATRGAHARSPLPASIKCRSPTWRVAQRRPPTTTQAKTTTDTE